jgi:universal stress protein E
MNTIRNILVIIDPAASEHPAAIKGALLAEKLGARVEQLACSAELHPLREIAAHVKRTNADLIIKDTRHHTFARRTVFSNTDWELIRGLSAPLLLTKANVWARSPTLLAAVDPGHDHDKSPQLDHCILDRASQFAQALPGELHVVHAYPCKVPVVAPIMAGPMLTASISPEALAAEHAARLKMLTRLADKYSLPPANLHLEIGGVRASICNVASRVHADIVVMGAMSRTGLARAFIGDTVEEVLERLPCDALIVKS